MYINSIKWCLFVFYSTSQCAFKETNIDRMEDTINKLLINAGKDKKNMDILV